MTTLVTIFLIVILFGFIIAICNVKDYISTSVEANYVRNRRLLNTVEKEQNYYSEQSYVKIPSNWETLSDDEIGKLSIEQQLEIEALQIEKGN